MKFVISNLKKNMLPLVFTILGIELILYSYLGKVEIVASSMIFILTIGFFALYDYVDKKETTGILIYIVASIIVFGICYILASVIESIDSVGFFNWFFNGENKTNNESLYTIPLSILLSFIFSSMYYYFTIKIIRMPVLLLLVFVDLILFIRGPYKKGNIFVCLYLLCFILMFIKKNKVDNSTYNISKSKNYKNTFFISGIIIIIALAISIVIPNNPLPNVSFLNGLKTYFRELKFSSYSNNFNVQENTMRKINSPGSFNNDEVLYTYKGQKIEYLITHSFDYFDNKKNMWQRQNLDYKVGYRFGSENLAVPIEKTRKKIKQTNEFKGDLADISEKDMDNTITKNIEIKVKNRSFTEFAHPQNTYECKTLKGNRFVYLNSYEQLFNGDNKNFAYGDNYNFIFVSDTPKKGSMEDVLLKYFNEKRYRDYLNKVNSTDKEFYEILDNYTKLDSNTSNKLISLSKSITKNKVSYYDKAKAIEDYFHSGKYKYNLDIKNTNKNNYIDYFVFDSKEGYCVQYATAMTLMCRAAGLPARYTEGFLIKDKNKTKNGYEVNAQNAHAFTEVYIPGYGWKIFDATPANLAEENKNNSNKVSLNINTKYIIIAAISLVVLTIIIFIVLLILKLTKRKRTIRKILKGSKEEALEGIIKYSVVLLKEIGLTINKEETLLNFSKRVDNKINIGFLNIVNKYYLVKYAGKKASNSDVNEALENNEKIYVYLKEDK